MDAEALIGRLMEYAPVAKRKRTGEGEIVTCCDIPQKSNLDVGVALDDNGQPKMGLR